MSRAAVNKFMKTGYTVAAALLVLLTACSQQTPEETVTQQTVQTQPESNHSLVRRWTMNELFSNVFFDGESHNFPFKMSDFEENGQLYGGRYSDNTILTANGGIIIVYETSGQDESEMFITRVEADNIGAPQDFSLYGIGFGASFSQIYDDFGIPDVVDGDEDENGRFNGTFTYIGAQNQRVILTLTDNKLTNFTLMQ